jgi:hypothetical protein
MPVRAASGGRGGGQRGGGQHIHTFAHAGKELRDLRQMDDDELQDDILDDADLALDDDAKTRFREAVRSGVGGASNVAGAAEAPFTKLYDELKQLEADRQSTLNKTGTPRESRGRRRSITRFIPVCQECQTLNWVATLELELE